MRVRDDTCERSVKRDDLTALPLGRERSRPSSTPSRARGCTPRFPVCAVPFGPTSWAPSSGITLLRDSITVDACVPGKALYLGADGCSLRFDLDVRGPNGSDPRRLLVLGRLLEDDEAVERYERAIAPMTAAMAERPDMAPFARLVASLPDRLVVHPFPIDADLPTLVGATDTALAAELLDAPAASCADVARALRPA